MYDYIMFILRRENPQSRYAVDPAAAALRVKDKPDRRRLAAYFLAEKAFRMFGNLNIHGDYRLLYSKSRFEDERFVLNIDYTFRKKYHQEVRQKYVAR